MGKKLLGGLALVAAIAYGVEVGLSVANGNVGMPQGVKALLVVAFSHYGFRAFKPAAPKAVQ